MENQVRDKSRILHHKKQERINVFKGNPTIGQVTQGKPETWFIPNEGLYDVCNYNNKLYYNKWSTSLST